MSLKAMPILFINLSGEMMYILDQRLRAQNISQEKSSKVMHDIVKSMFNDQFVEELFKPQEIYTKQAIRTVFEKLVHSSIMRLNGTSMDKLYDLMTMVFKYQLTLCPRPEDVLFVTLNHIDGIRAFSEDSEEVVALVDNVYSLLIQHYAEMSAGQFHRLRFLLLTFFQDLHIRVSVLLKTGCQRPDGKFVLPPDGPIPYDSKLPGTTTVYEPDESITDMTSISFGERNEYSPPVGSMDRHGDRGTKLGRNIYLEHELSEKQAKSSEPINSRKTESNEQPTTSACEQLSFLSRLIGQKGVCNQWPEFTLGVIDDVEDARSCNSPPNAENSNVVNINVSQRMEESMLFKIMGDLTVEHKESDEQDILELLDVASA